MNEKLKENLIPIILSVLLLASIVGNIVLFNKVSGNNDSVTAMGTQLATSESQIQDLQNQINSLQGQIEEKEAVINELNSQITILQEQITTLESAKAESESVDVDTEEDAETESDTETEVASANTETNTQQTESSGNTETQQQPSTETPSTPTQTQTQQPTQPEDYGDDAWKYVDEWDENIAPPDGTVLPDGAVWGLPDPETQRTNRDVIGHISDGYIWGDM